MTGDAMARPLIEEYERKAATGTPYDGSSLFAISSSAAIFSPPVKERWMAAFPNAVFTDSVGASETGFQGMGMQDKERDQHRRPGRRRSVPSSVVIDDDNHVARPGDQRRQGRPARPRRHRAGRLLQGPREVGEDVPRDRRRALLGARRLRPDRGGQPGHPARPRLQLRQHRRREGLPRGGRDGDQGPPRRLRRASWSASPTRSTARPWPPSSSPARARPSSSRSCATSCATTCPATSCRASLTLVDEIPRNATGKAQYPAAKEMALALRRQAPERSDRPDAYAAV